MAGHALSKAQQAEYYSRRQKDGAAAADKWKQGIVSSGQGTGETVTKDPGPNEGTHPSTNQPPSGTQAGKTVYADQTPTPTTTNVASTDIGKAANVAPTQLGPASQMQAAQLGPASQSRGVNLAPSANAQAARLGPMSTAAGSQLNLANDNQFRGNQQALISQLQAQANGTGPSIANAQFQAAAQQNMQAQLAMAASQRGTAGGLAGRQAMMNNAGIGQNLAQQSAIQRLAEQIQAQQALGNVVNQGRAADIGIAQQNAGLMQGNQQFNAGQLNTGALTQAGYSQQANLQNALQANTMAQAQGTLSQANNQYNTTAQNQFGLQQGTFNQAANASNADALNAANLAQGQLTYGANAQNATAANNLISQQGAINANAASQNATAANNMGQFGAGLQQQIDLANAGAANQGQLTQAQINAGMKNAATSAAGQVGYGQAIAGGNIGVANINAAVDLTKANVANDNANSGGVATAP